MATVYVLQAVRGGLTETQREALRGVARVVGLGEPALVTDGQGTAWAVYDDGRFRPKDAALAAIILTHAAEFPDFDPEAVADVRAECLRFCAARGLVWPVPGLDEAENPYQAAYDAQGAPPIMRVVM